MISSNPTERVPMCSPNNKYPPRPELAGTWTDIDDPLNFIPTDLRTQEIQPSMCPRCGQPMKESEVSSREAFGRDGPYIRAGVHDQCPMVNQPRKKKLVHHIDQPPVKIIYDRDNVGPQL
jgi:hypothetical protein